jgi:hypothetical protein
MFPPLSLFLGQLTYLARGFAAFILKIASVFDVSLRVVSSKTYSEHIQGGLDPSGALFAFFHLRLDSSHLRCNIGTCARNTQQLGQKVLRCSVPARIFGRSIRLRSSQAAMVVAPWEEQTSYPCGNTVSPCRVLRRSTSRTACSCIN